MCRLGESIAKGRSSRGGSCARVAIFTHEKREVELIGLAAAWVSALRYLRMGSLGVSHSSSLMPKNRGHTTSADEISSEEGGGEGEQGDNPKERRVGAKAGRKRPDVGRLSFHSQTLTKRECYRCHPTSHTYTLSQPVLVP